MSTSPEPVDFDLELVTRRKARIQTMRERARGLLENGSTGIQVATAISEGMDELHREMYETQLQEMPEAERSTIQENSALVAIGGSGRGEMAPWSDSDLLFVYQPSAEELFADFVSHLVRNYWDADVKLGHSVRTVTNCVDMARREIEFATATLHCRLLAGNAELFNQLRHQTSSKAIGKHIKNFVQNCVTTRQNERNQFGAAVHQLEPDVKRSPGGLRDVQLIIWLAAACHGAANIDSIRLQGLLSRSESNQLLAAHEFLMRIRMDLHFHAGRAQERLTRDEQLRLAEQRRITGTSGQRPVERLMQQYFRHASAVSRLAEQFAQQHLPRSLTSRVLQAIVSHRFDGVFKMGPQGVTVRRRNRDAVCGSLESILKLYHAASLYGAPIAPEMTEPIKVGMTGIRQGLSDESARSFRKIMRTRGNLGSLLRHMYDTGVLEYIIPDMTHARCLLQFNQYHSYTVDEHTLRAIETVESFEHDSGPVGTAYREIRHKATLHLAILLHDLGKGFDEDHSDVGARIAERIGIRIQSSPHKREILVRLVQNHLSMAHLAFRRDFSDPDVLMPFSRMVGSPEVLRMLYVLTAADVTAVGPDAWTEWKAELLAELYERVMLIVSGKQYERHEAEKRESVKQYVRSAIVPLFQTSQSDWDSWIDSQLEAFPPHYISGVSLENITADLDSLQQLGPNDVIADGQFHAETNTVDYRIITQGSLTEGCFHKLAGVLTAKHLEIITAQISTSKDGVVLDRFRVIDQDFSEQVPAERIREVTQAVEDTLYGRTTVEQLFQKHRRFGGQQKTAAVSDLQPRVVIDNNSTDSATIIDVFTHDSPGLLYTLAKTVYDLGLSVLQARIGTHLDQVVDVFYVRDHTGRKLRDGSILQHIKDTLTQQISDFEGDDERPFGG